MSYIDQITVGPSTYDIYSKQVNGHTVATDVPAGAVFTDTTYTPASAIPLMDGTGAVGTSSKYAREDHKHPSDTTKLDKSGGTLTGTLIAKSDMYYESNNTYGLNMSNSDVIGLNGLYMNDQADSAGEGINFVRDSSHWDTFRVLNGKAQLIPNRPTNTASGIEGIQDLYAIPKYGTGTTDISIRPLIAFARANRFAFLPADQIIIENTTNGGTTWVDAGYNDWSKRALFATRGTTLSIPLLNGERNEQCGIRVTFTAMKYNVPDGTTETNKYNYWNSTYIKSQERYSNLREMWFWLSANSDNIRVQVYRATGASPNNWVTEFDTNFGLTGWSGSDWIRLSGSTFGGATTQTGNYWNWRVIFWSRKKDGTSEFTGTTAQTINGIAGYGDSVWGAPNGLMKEDHLYTWDVDQNATFPSKITATSFVGSLTGNASTATSATKATQDESGNNIKSSYGASLDISGSVLTLKNKNSAALSSVTLPAAPVTSVNGKTGVVTLVASDVGALPTTTPIPAAYTATPAALGTASAGSSPSWARGDHVHAKPTYSKSDVGLGNVDNVKQYSASNPPPYPVTSVNGSTGAVTITLPSIATVAPKDLASAASVGASTKYAKEDHIHKYPTPAQIGAGTYSKPSGGIPATDLASGVIPSAYTSNPAALGTASPGSSTSWARGDHVHAKPTYDKSDVGLGNVDNVKQYSASNPPPYPVTSVNGSTGAVSINAVPAGGSEGQVLAKTSSGYGWVDMASTLTFTVENENLSILQI